MLKPVRQIEELVLVALHNHDRPVEKIFVSVVETCEIKSVTWHWSDLQQP